MDIICGRSERFSYSFEVSHNRVFMIEKVQFDQSKNFRSSHHGTMSSESDYSSPGHCGGMGSIPGPVQWVQGPRAATAVV